MNFLKYGFCIRFISRFEDFNILKAVTINLLFILQLVVKMSIKLQFEM